MFCVQDVDLNNRLPIQEIQTNLDATMARRNYSNSDRGDGAVRFSTPKVFVFFLALFLAILAIVDKLNIVPSIPSVLVDQTFWLVFIAYVLLMLGNLLRSL